MPHTITGRGVSLHEHPDPMIQLMSQVMGDGRPLYVGHIHLPDDDVLNAVAKMEKHGGVIEKAVLAVAGDNEVSDAEIVCVLIGEGRKMVATTLTVEGEKIIAMLDITH